MCLESNQLITDSPSDVVEKFAQCYKNEDIDSCYSLMSNEYKNSTDRASFNNKMKHPNNLFNYYEFVGIVEGSEIIQRDSASVTIVYRKMSQPVLVLEKILYLTGIKKDTREKTITLVNENGEWKFNEICYELNGRTIYG
jgi:hypothetical protein